MKGGQQIVKSLKKINLSKLEEIGNTTLREKSLFICCFCATRLKVPKREIFDRSDFPEFYTIKSLRVGDFGVKINK